MAPGEIRVAFLKRVHERHPRDFWVNARLGQLLIYVGKPEQAVGYYQAALAIRPGVSMVHSNLGVALTQANRPDEAIGHFRQAVALDPAGVTTRENLVPGLWNLGRKDEALREFPVALRLNPRSAVLHTLAGKILESDNQQARPSPCTDRPSRSIRNPRAAKRELRAFLMRQGREDDARVAWEKALDEDPSEHDSVVRVRRILPVPRTGGGLSARPPGLAREVRRDEELGHRGKDQPGLFAPARVGRGTASDRRPRGSRRGRSTRRRLRAYYPFFQFVQGLAEYRQGHLDRAISLMRGEASGVLGPAPRLVLAMALHQDGRVAEARKTLAEAVLAYDWRAVNGARPGRLDLPCAPPRGRGHDPARPAGVPGREATEPHDNDERLALLGVCQFMNRTLAQASLYADAFAADPQLAEDVGAGHRYSAACAAALAGSGHGEDVDNLERGGANALA